MEIKKNDSIDKPIDIIVDDFSNGIHKGPEVYSQIKKLLNIPDDEPIFIFRAQDKFAVNILKYYRGMVRDGNRNRTEEFFLKWYDNMGSIVNEFIKWKNNNRNKVKVPD